MLRKPQCRLDVEICWDRSFRAFGILLRLFWDSGVTVLPTGLAEWGACTETTELGFGVFCSIHPGNGTKVTGISGSDHCIEP